MNHRYVCVCVNEPSKATNNLCILSNIYSTILILNMIIMFIHGTYISIVKAVYIIVSHRSIVTCVTVLRKVIPTMCSMVHMNSNWYIYVAFCSI